MYNEIVNNAHKKKLAFLSLFFVLLIDGMGQGLIFPMLSSSLTSPNSQFFIQHASIGLRDTLYSIIIGVFFLGWFFGAPFLSNYSDHIGRKKVIAICLVGTILGYLLTVFGFIFHSILFLLLGRAVDGFTAGSQPIAQAAIVDMSEEESRTRNIGLILLAVSLGLILGPLLGGILSDSNISSWFRYTTPLYVATGLSIFNLIILSMYFSETRTTAKQKKEQLSHAFSLLISALKEKSIRILSISFFLFQFSWTFYYIYTNAYLTQQFHASGLNIGLFTAFLGASLGLGFTFVVRLCEKFNKVFNIIAGYGLVALSALCISLIHKESIVWLSAIPCGLGLAAAYSNSIGLFSLQTNADKQGWIMGITSAIVAMAAGIASFIIGPLASITPLTPYILAGVFFIIGAVILGANAKQLSKNEE